MTADRAPRVLVSGLLLGQPMGGVRRHNAELLPRAAELLEQAGGGMAVLTGRDPIGFELPAGVQLLPSSVPASPPLARGLQESRALTRHLRAAATAGNPFDVVHTAHLPAPRGLPVPYTITIHDLRSLELQHTPFSRRFFAGMVVGRAVSAAACTIAVSETVRSRVVESFNPQRIAVVPNAGDHLDYLPRDVGGDAPLLHVGHLEPRKNLELLLRALALDETLPDLWLAGAAKHGEDERLKSKAKKLGVLERVRFLGRVPDEDLPGLYARCLCVVIPSRLEGFGIPALEAQRSQAPLAIASAGALPEVAGEGVPRFAPDDPEGCVGAIQEALRLRIAKIQEHAKRAGRFRWGESAKLLVAIWSEAAALRR